MHEGIVEIRRLMPRIKDAAFAQAIANYVEARLSLPHTLTLASAAASHVRILFPSTPLPYNFCVCTHLTHSRGLQSANHLQAHIEAIDVNSLTRERLAAFNNRLVLGAYTVAVWLCVYCCLCVFGVESAYLVRCSLYLAQRSSSFCYPSDLTAVPSSATRCSPPACT